ncbi:MAG: hypothetical protein K2W78_14550 [Xanthobacteraceae bacterium]|nr:hypothetical protein [Xanthobacteraceae bacterium]
MAEQNADGKITAPGRLREALHKARIEAADRTSVVVDLRDAEMARLEILNEALDPLFSEIPAGVELFDRGISQGDAPRLWIDAISHIGMGRDKRTYRFVQDTRFGRTVLAETHDVPSMVNAVTDYIARRMIERDQALVVPALPAVQQPRMGHKPRGAFWPFVLGVIVGVVALFAVALFASLRNL